MTLQKIGHVFLERLFIFRSDVLIYTRGNKLVIINYTGQTISITASLWQAKDQSW